SFNGVCVDPWFGTRAAHRCSESHLPPVNRLTERAIHSQPQWHGERGVDVSRLWCAARVREGEAARFICPNVARSDTPYSTRIQGRTSKRVTGVDGGTAWQ